MIPAVPSPQSSSSHSLKDTGNDSYWRSNFTENFVTKKDDNRQEELRSEASLEHYYNKKVSITPSITESNDSNVESAASTTTSCPSNPAPSESSVQLIASLDNGIIVTSNYLPSQAMLPTKDNTLSSVENSNNTAVDEYYQQLTPSPTTEQLELTLSSCKETDLRTRFEGNDNRRDSTKSAEPLISNRTSSSSDSRYRRKGQSKPSIRYYSSSDLSSSKTSLSKSKSSPCQLFTGSRFSPFKSLGRDRSKHRRRDSNLSYTTRQRHKSTSSSEKVKEKAGKRFKSINSILQSRR